LTEARTLDAKMDTTINAIQERMKDKRRANQKK
jgi:hypothetical protein